MMVYICTKFHENISTVSELWSGHEKWTDGGHIIQPIFDGLIKINMVGLLPFSWKNGHTFRVASTD